MSDKKAITTVRLPGELREQLREKSYLTRWSINQLMVQAAAIRLAMADDEVETTLHTLGRTREGRLPEDSEGSDTS